MPCASVAVRLRGADLDDQADRIADALDADVGWLEELSKRHKTFSEIAAVVSGANYGEAG